MTDIISSITNKLSFFANKNDDQPNNDNDNKIDLDTFDKLSDYDLDKYGRQVLELPEDYIDNKLLNADGSGQKFRELEFFVSNDGSKEGTFFNHILN